MNWSATRSGVVPFFPGQLVNWWIGEVVSQSSGRGPSGSFSGTGLVTWWIRGLVGQSFGCGPLFSGAELVNWWIGELVGLSFGCGPSVPPIHFYHSMTHRVSLKEKGPAEQSTNPPIHQFHQFILGLVPTL